MKNFLMLISLLTTIVSTAFSQSDDYWSANRQSRSNIVTDKSVARVTFPKVYELFNLNATTLRTKLFSVVDAKGANKSTVISLPNVKGNLEQFEIFEASNFEPALQAKFPEIRAFSGRGITDKHATLKLSISPQGIQTMVFRADNTNEFIEPFSKDHRVYAVFNSHRERGELAWTCTTEDKDYDANLKKQLPVILPAASGTSTGTVKTMRLAQSCTGEYANYFGATSAAQVNLVLAAYNNTLTRCNGVYEKDLALHLNLINETTNIIFYDPNSDPYSIASVGTSSTNSNNANGWNIQLQNTINTFLGGSIAASNALYDIGHLFGASGGGGNAGCIGCVCVNPTANGQKQKGSGYTSPKDGIPLGDNFDIDYVAHEVGHQLGANHTYSHVNESTGVNKEVGSGITIMGYAGITSQDVAPHSIDIFHQASIAQIQANLATKTCPVSVSMTANTAPAVATVNNFTIPISTPFALTASATDAQGDALTYCWEQNDNTTTTGASSVASPTKATGPNWLTFPATASGTRTFPRLSTILAGLNVTGPLPGGDAGANIEALSSVSRTLNFRVTVRDNHPYVAGSTIGQTAFTDAVVTVSNTSGPFAVTAPNTAVTWSESGSATVTWSVNNTTAAPVSCANVNILLSIDGGNTFPYVLASTTANDGTETVTVPTGTQSTTCRVKVESVGNIFFDISNANFTIGAPALCGDASGLTTSAITQTSATVSWTAVSGATSYAVDYKTSAASTWTSAAAATTATSVNLTGLTAGTVYDWRVRATCAAGNGNFVQAQFSTTTPPSTCPGIYDVSTNGTTSGAAVIPFNTDIKGTVSASGDNDYYKFTITTGGTITMTLTTLPANYHLRLLNSSGSTLQTSSNSGTNNETINRTVTAGTYYARVYPSNGNQWNATNCYTLRVQLGTASRMGEETQGLITANKLTVFPNPATTTASLLFKSEITGNAFVTVTNQTGAVVLSQTMAVGTGDNYRNLNVGKLPNGVYFVKIRTGDKVEMARIIIAK